jgi:hypothetical protein
VSDAFGIVRTGAGPGSGRGYVLVITARSADLVRSVAAVVTFVGLLAAGSCSSNGDTIVDSTGALLLSEVPKRFLAIGGGAIGLEFADVNTKLERGRAGEHIDLPPNELLLESPKPSASPWLTPGT